MEPRKTNTGKANKTGATTAAKRASAKRFASAFYRKHGAVMSKLSRA